ncbi:adenylate cyclase [Rhizobium bangladeshense]|uniref:Adenylate cyclase n=1 Tax=Rhizobium bangladeshense TaxID=1138189 RepID=A0ABS7LCK4_9HYPH|nr:adenylate cyclase [Rhizobium bangladeshense]MBX4870847.1 adenylate cyclase [Rhizobium bangladeshense]MBX4876330.1 adenylate cyclase [Rhizobium bangladeshense]MBX4887295.1 adenylate cyclase [Rhizobium bangladeshense]MBX4897517.1 adenylate cyclase [Rhizobium bangladeshense]MBY3589169.1 adenylate cyclase [Rhizobium bangladeshense]
MLTSMPPEGSAAPFPSESGPQAHDITRQLERVISSPEFPGVGRAAAFLRYVVSETLAGRGNRIKAYSIAIEVFGRDTGFTQDDPVVRIEAGRLRRSLERYYLVAGQHDPIRIDIPKGGYVPTFTWSCPASADTRNEDVEALPSPARPGRWERARQVLLLGAIVVTMLALSLYWLAALPTASSLQRAASPSPDRPALVVAPFANLGEGPEAQLYSAGLTEELMTVLPRFKEIKVFGRETSRSLPADVRASEIRAEFGARYLLTGGVRTSGQRLRVTARLLDTSDGEILWSENYDKDLASGDLFAIQTDVARKVATAIAQPYGVMAQVDAASPPPDDLGAYECTLRFYAYRSELSAEAHSRVRSCLESAIARFPNYATAWAMLSIVYLDEDRYRFNSTRNKEATIEHALGAARRATQLDPSNTRGLQALMTTLFFDRQLPESLRVGEQALATNPNDTELMGEFGTRLAMGGQWRRGAALLDEAIALNPGGGGFYHGTRALAAYMLHDNHTALLQIRQANMQKFPLFHVVAAIIYAEAGMMEDARREGEVFVAMRPDFLPNIATELAIRNIQPDDRDRLIRGLRKAGLTVPDPDKLASSVTGISELQPR